MTILTILVIVITLLFFGEVLLKFGDQIIEPLGWFGFFGNFIFILGDIIIMLAPPIAILSIGGAIGGLFGQIGQNVSDKLSEKTAKLINLIVTPISFALIAIIIMQAINWFYQFANPNISILYPGIIGAIAGLLLAIKSSATEPLPTGMMIYFDFPDSAQWHSFR